MQFPLSLSLPEVRFFWADCGRVLAFITEHDIFTVVNFSSDVCFSYRLKMAECTSQPAVELQLHGLSIITCRSTVTVIYHGRATRWNCRVSYRCCHLVELLSSVMTGAVNYLLYCCWFGRFLNTFQILH